MSRCLQQFQSQLLFLESCCDKLTLETWGMADFYQGERLGKYSKVGTSSDGRFVFKQDGGDNYLYYLSQYGVGYFISLFQGAQRSVSAAGHGTARQLLSSRHYGSRRGAARHIMKFLTVFLVLDGRT